MMKLFEIIVNILMLFLVGFMVYQFIRQGTVPQGSFNAYILLSLTGIQMQFNKLEHKTKGQK